MWMSVTLKEDKKSEVISDSFSEKAEKAVEETAAVVSHTPHSSSTWIFDTGASSHITSNSDILINLKPT